MNARRIEDEDSEGSLGFLDVAANALAIIMLTTLLLISASQAMRSDGESVRVNEREILGLPERQDAAFPPLSMYHIVTAEGLARVDLASMVKEFKTGRTFAQTDQGMLSATASTTRRDYDVFFAEFTPNLDYFRGVAEPIDPVAGTATSLAAAFGEQTLRPTFLVLPEATDTFTPLYWALREARVPFRWFALTSKKIPLSRHHRNYARRTSRW